MYRIRLLSEDDFDQWYPVVSGAYPAFRLPKEQKREYFERTVRSTAVDWFGSFDGERMVGCYRPHYFSGNLFGVMTPVAGLGGVAVDLLHKRKGVCRNMVRRFHDDMRARGYGLACLYPFRPSFYRALGYGWGTRVHRLQIRPAALRVSSAGASGGAVLETADPAECLAYLNRYAETRHGMIQFPDDAFSQSHFSDRMQTVALRREGRITGALRYAFVNLAADNDFCYDLEVYSLYWDSPADLRELLAFVGAQSDQARYAFINTDRDDFVYLLDNIGVEGGFNVLGEFHTAGLDAYGMLYRIIDLPTLVAQTAHRDYHGVSMTLEANLADPEAPDGRARCVLRFDKGRLHLDPAATPEVSLSMDLADFSSLWMGCVSLRRLHEYGLVTVSDPGRVRDLDELFAVAQPPHATVVF